MIPAPEPSPVRPSSSRLRRVLAIGAGVAMVPALYAVASATTGSGGGDSRPAAVVQARAGSDDPGTELETEHGVVVEKPHGGATTPSVPEVTTPTVPVPTTPTTPEVEVEHPVPEPGDDNGVDAPGDDEDDDGAVAPVPSGTQSFSSAGGSITVTVTDGVLSLTSSSPAAGYGAEVHDNGPSRVEVRFTNGDDEWRIRIEVGSGALTSEITQHG